MTNERPMLYSAPMVRGLLNDTKTQTRRLVKPQPKNDRVGMVNAAYCGFPNTWLVDGAVSEYTCEDEKAPVWVCPYGKPGDRLWVRESFFQRGRWGLPEHPEAEAEDRYWIGSKEIAYAANVKRPGHDWRSRPSIHMPRWASRITLEITEVRVERLQEISEADAIAEGIERSYDQWRDYRTDQAVNYPSAATPIESYHTLWESINGPGSWDANPWVWAVSFIRLKGGQP